jgi:hypothetical protein
MVFTPRMVVLNVDETLGLVNPQHSCMKISLGAMNLWFSKFFKLAHDAHDNHAIVL